MSLNRSVIGKCILCGEEVYKSENSITTEEGICHQRCIYGTEGAVKA